MPDRPVCEKNIRVKDSLQKYNNNHHTQKAIQIYFETRKIKYVICEYHPATKKRKEDEEEACFLEVSVRKTTLFVFYFFFFIFFCLNLKINKEILELLKL